MAALKPEKKIELFSGTYFGACTLGGIIGIVPNLPPNPCSDCTTFSDKRLTCDSLPSLRPNSHRRNPPGPRKMPAPSRPQNLLLQPPSLAQHHLQRRPPRRLLWMGPHLRRLFLPGSRKIRRLRGLQILLRRETLPQQPANHRLPRRQRDGRVHRRYLPLPFRSHQSPYADHAAALRPRAARGVVESRG